jgi:CRISPR/Cas system-associated exonuclease Cas4 (RecB family)
MREGLHVSVSQLKTYVMCPRKFEYSYVTGTEPEFLPVSLAFGSAFHAALAAFYGEIKTKGTLPPLEEVQEVFRGAWEVSVQGDVPLQVDEEEEASNPMDKGMVVVGAFYADAASKPVPKVLGVEKPFSVAIHDPDTGEELEESLVGALDLVISEDNKWVIVEHKTSARKFSQDQLTCDIQPTAYSLAAKKFGLLDAKLRYQVVTKTKTPVVQVDDVTRTNHDEDDFLRLAVGVLKAVDAGASYPLKGWQCRGCQFQRRCRGGA